MSLQGEKFDNALPESIFLVLKLLRSQQEKFPQAYEALVKELVSNALLLLVLLSLSLSLSLFLSLFLCWIHS